MIIATLGTYLHIEDLLLYSYKWITCLTITGVSHLKLGLLFIYEAAHYLNRLGVEHHYPQ